MTSASLSYLLVTGRVMRDEYSGGLYSFIDVFERVFIPKDSSSTVKSLVVAGKLHLTFQGPLSLEVIIFDPEGKEFAKDSSQGTVNIGDLEIAINFPLLMFEKTGKYVLKVRFNGDFLEDGGRYYFEVVKAQ